MSENKTQDPKFVIIDGQLANAATREFIPDDEPVFIMRAKDIHAYTTLGFYSTRVQDDDHRVAVDKRMSEFLAFREAHPNRMDEPDTVGADSWPDYNGKEDNART